MQAARQTDGNGEDTAPALSAQRRMRNSKAKLLFDCSGRNGDSVTRTLMLFDKASAVVNGAFPLDQVDVPANSTASFAYVTGRPFTNGIVMAFSTAANQLTLTGNVGWFTAVYSA